MEANNNQKEGTLKRISGVKKRKNCRKKKKKEKNFQNTKGQ